MKEFPNFTHKCVLKNIASVILLIIHLFTKMNLSSLDRTLEGGVRIYANSNRCNKSEMACMNSQNDTGYLPMLCHPNFIHFPFINSIVFYMAHHRPLSNINLTSCAKNSMSRASCCFRCINLASF